MFRKKDSTSEVEEIVRRVRGVDANEFYPIELITTPRKIHIILDNKTKNSYGYAELDMLYVDSDHVCLAFGKMKYMIWAQRDNAHLRELEDEIKESAKKAKLAQSVQKVERQMKKEKKSNEQNRGKKVLSMLISLFFVLTVCAGGQFAVSKGYHEVLFSMMDELIRGEEMVDEEKINYLEGIYDNLLDSKNRVIELQSFVKLAECYGEEDVNNLLKDLQEIEADYKSSKITDYSQDQGYISLADNFVKTNSGKIYNKIEKVLNSLFEHPYTEESDFTEAKEDLDEINRELYTILNDLVSEIQKQNSSN